MVFIPLIHRLRAVQHHCLPLRPAARHDIIPVPRCLCCIPGAVRFQVCLVNDIQTVLVTQPVKHRRIRVMARAHGIDVILLHDGKVFADVLF